MSAGIQILITLVQNENLWWVKLVNYWQTFWILAAILIFFSLRIHILYIWILCSHSIYFDMNINFVAQRQGNIDNIIHCRQPFWVLAAILDSGWVTTCVPGFFWSYIYCQHILKISCWYHEVKYICAFSLHYQGAYCGVTRSHLLTPHQGQQIASFIPQEQGRQIIFSHSKPETADRIFYSTGKEQQVESSHSTPGTAELIFFPEEQGSRSHLSLYKRREAVWIFILSTKDRTGKQIA